MKVVMLKETNYKGSKLIGEAYEVDDSIAHRWISKGIAEAVVSEPLDPTDTDNEFEGMNAKQLYALCKEKELEVEAKQPAEYYISKLKGE